MGNYLTCSLLHPGSGGGGKRERAAKVVLPGGEIRQIEGGGDVKAAELMLENPNCFLVNARSIHAGRRFSALGADEELEPANVYVVLPMSRLNSVATAADLALLFLTGKRAASSFRISPEAPPPQPLPEPSDEPPAVPKLNLDDIDDPSTLQLKHRLSHCRSKKPLLETIAEEPISSR